MAGKSDVVKKIMRFKLQLSDTAEPATVLNVLQKLKGLDITLDILSETGIGKTVNSLRRRKRVGEFAKLLVKSWKKLVPKETTSQGDDAAWLHGVSVKNKEDDQSLSDNDGIDNNCPKSNHKDQDTSDEQTPKVLSKRERFVEEKRKPNINKNEKKHQEEGKRNVLNVSKSKAEIQRDKMDDNFVSKMKKQNNDFMLGSKTFVGSNKNFKSDSKEELKGTSQRERQLGTKLKPSKESSTKNRETFSSRDKHSKALKGAKEEKTLEMSRSSEAQNRKRKKTDYERPDHLKRHSDTKGNKQSKHKKAKVGDKDAESNSELDEPSMSFESYLNYDANLQKKKEYSGVKRTPKVIKSASKERASKDPGTKPLKSFASFPEQPQESLMHLMDIPLPAALPELEKSSNIDYYFEKKADKEPGICDASEESAVFTGQRLNTKMQVYSGAKTLFLPTMMSLYQQCIRTLQNNLNLLYETGGVPFELLEPVLERCTPDQLLRIEEYNPIYIGLTDHLWGKHCQRDFKDCKLQEYESWKEMFIRLSKERERKLKQLTKTIVSAHSNKPKGRQVKMAFIHSVAKPPRDVRIQQEIHGTAVQQPHQLKSSSKHQDNQMRSSCNESNRSSSSNSSSNNNNNQDLRKKTKVAPMMAKSLKAFKKQLGRR